MSRFFLEIQRQNEKLIETKNYEFIFVYIMF